MVSSPAAFIRTYSLGIIESHTANCIYSYSLIVLQGVVSVATPDETPPVNSTLINFYLFAYGVLQR
jgi:hypothetical protein